MRRVTALLIVAILLVVAGCVGNGGRSPSPTMTETAPSTPSTGTPSTGGATSTATPATGLTCVGDDPKKGTNLLSVSRVSEETVEGVNASKRADYRNLTAEQQAVFRAALARDCNLVQSVFRFNDGDRVEYVRYDGSWYFLRVSIV